MLIDSMFNGIGRYPAIAVLCERLLASQRTAELFKGICMRAPSAVAIGALPYRPTSIDVVARCLHHAYMTSQKAKSPAV